MARKIGIIVEVDSNGAVEFVRLADAAGKADDSLGKLGTTATRAGADVDKAGNSARKSSTDWDELGRVAGTAAAAVGLASVKMAGDAEVANLSLERSYGDAAASFQAFANEIQSTTIFSDDQAIAAANAASGLARNYGFTNDQIKQLIQTSTDLASIQGISLADASERVAAAMRGEAEGAEALGLTLNDSAIGIDNLAASTTDAEKAQVRFTALLEQSAYAAGAAGDVRELDSQRWRVWANEAQDSLQGIGSALTDFQGPILALGAGAQVLGPLGDAFTALGSKAKAASLAASAFSLATGPVGLVLAVGGAAAAVYAFSQRESEAEQQTRELDEATTAYTATLQELTTALVSAGAHTIVKQTADELVEMEINGKIAQDRIEALVAVQNSLALDSLNDVAGDGNIYDQIEGLDGYVRSALAASDANRDGAISATEYANAMAILTAGFEASEGEMTALRNAAGALLDDIANPDLAGAEIAAEVQRIVDGVHDGTILLADGIAMLNAIETSGLDTFNLALRESEAAALAAAEAYEAFEARRGDRSYVDTLTPEIQARDRKLAQLEEEHQAEVDNLAAREASAAQQRILAMWGMDDSSARRRVLEEEAAAERELHDAAMDRQRSNAAGAAEEAARIGARGDALRDLAGAEFGLLEAQQGGINARQISIATSEREATALEAARAQVAALAAAYESITGRDFDLDSLATSTGDIKLNVAVDTTAAQASLETTFRLAVGNTNATSGLVDSVLDWGDELINVEGTYAKIDELRAKGLISEDRYGMAQRAYNRMVEDGAGIQEDILAIQAKQAPYIANDVRNLERQYSLLAEMEPSAARIALGFMDGSQSAAAMAFHSQLQADIMSGMASDNADFWNATIDGLETSNPGLLAMLETTGEVKKTLDDAGNWDGFSYEVNLEGAEEGKTEIADLTTALTELTDAIYEVFIGGDGSGALGAVEAVGLALGELDGDSATVTVNATDHAGGVISAVAIALGNLDGDSATTTVYTNYVSTGSTDVGFTIATGGYVSARDIDTMASGGHSAGRRALVGETGPEFVTLPFGSTVTNSAATSSQMERDGGRGGGDIHLHGPVYITAATPDIHDALNTELLAQGRR